MSWAVNQKIFKSKDVSETINENALSKQYERIISYIGQHNISAFVPLINEGGMQSDIINNSVKFEYDTNTAIKKNGGPLGNYLFWNSDVNLRETPTLEVNNGGTSPTYKPKHATLVPRGMHKTLITSKISAMLSMEGSAPDATIRLSWYKDNGGEPGDRLFYTKGAVVNNIPSAKCADLSPSAKEIVFPSIEELNVDRWLVLEYIDYTGIDASNYVKWDYGNKTGYKRASFDGSSWTVINNESHNLSIYSNDVTLNKDFTIFIPAYLAGTNETLLLIKALGIDSLNLTHKIETNQLFLNATLNSPDKLEMKARYSFIKYNQWNVFAINFNFKKAHDKITLYDNGKLLIPSSFPAGPTFAEEVGGTSATNRKGLLGLGSTGLIDGRVYIGTDLSQGYNYSVKGVGPILIVNKSCTHKEISEISNLMSLNKINEEI